MRTTRSGLGMGLLVSVVTLLLLFGALEVGARLWIGSDERMYLPYVGVSEDVQYRAQWRDLNAMRSLIGTTSYPTAIDVIDDRLGWRVKPNVDVQHEKPGVYQVHIVVGDHGIRGLEHALERDEGQTQVGFFGCSQTFGETVTEGKTYVDRLNDRFQGGMFNFGVRGYGTDQMLLDYRERGNLFDLDVVVLSFAFYHLERNRGGFFFYAKPYFELDDDDHLVLHGVPVPSIETLRAEPIEDQLWTVLDHSVLARWAWQKVRNIRFREIYSTEGRVWRVTEAMIAAFVEEVRARGARAVVLNIDEARPELEAPLAAVVQRTGAEFINLGPALRAVRDADPPYFLPADNHWTESGHQLVADQVASAFCEKQLLACSSSSSL